MNPLIDDGLVSFLLHDVLDVSALTALPRFAAHSREGFDMAVASAARFAREVMAPTVRAMEADQPRFENGRIETHAALKDMYAQMVAQGFLTMARPENVGGMQFPTTVSLVVTAYLGAANMGAAGYIGLTHGAARLIETFGSPELQETFMKPMYEGCYTGTMALTEPQAGSSLADVRTRATPQEDGHYLIEGEKIFISGGDNTFAENVVHLTLARIDGAVPGVKGVSLFAVPAKRVEGGALVANDVHASGLFHKIGWKGLPSIALKYGEEGKCRGYLVGKPGEGLKCMFQMMNEARLNVGMAGVSNCSAAYQAALEYARNRPQGRAMSNRDATSPQIPITEHADVRRMLLAQKAIVEGGLALLLTCGKYQDLAEAAEGEIQRRSQKLLDLLTPIAKSFPAEKGFEANVLAIQVHGGYGYTSEYLPELLLREQKLNSLHEGTTGIQSLDLLGRKIFMDMGESVGLLAEEMRGEIEIAAKDAALAEHAQVLAAAIAKWNEVLGALGARAGAGDMEGALATSVWHLDLASTIVIGWQWLRMARVATGAIREGKRAACAYWFTAEMTKVPELAARVLADPVYRNLSPDAL